MNDTEKSHREFHVTRDLFLEWRSPRYGALNPTVMNNHVWEWLIETGISAYQATAPNFDGIEILTYDVYSKIVQLVTAPMEGEPQDAQDACVTPNIPPYSCKDPGDHVFWDGIHPTKAVHSILADDIGALPAQ